MEEVEQHITSKKFWSYLHHVDYKFLFIPIVFIFLRIWSVIQGIIFDYAQLHVDKVPLPVTQALFYLSVRALLINFGYHNHTSVKFLLIVIIGGGRCRE